MATNAPSQSILCGVALRDSGTCHSEIATTAAANGTLIKKTQCQEACSINHPPKTVDRVGFDQVVLGMDPETVGRFWIDRKIRGGSGPPRTVESLATLRRVVEKLPGALGYLRPAIREEPAPSL